MGRYSHEAVAVDPATGFVDETEDAGNSSGFYRFVPDFEGDLSRGGRPYMLKVQGVHQANLTGAFANDTIFGVEWVEITDSRDVLHSPQGLQPVLGGLSPRSAAIMRGSERAFARIRRPSSSSEPSCSSSLAPA